MEVLTDMWAYEYKSIMDPRTLRFVQPDAPAYFEASWEKCWNITTNKDYYSKSSAGYSFPGVRVQTARIVSDDHAAVITKYDDTVKALEGQIRAAKAARQAYINEHFLEWRLATPQEAKKIFPGKPKPGKGQC